MDKSLVCRSCGQFSLEYEPENNIGLCYNCTIKQIQTLESELQQYKEALRLACGDVVDLEMNYDGYSHSIETLIDIYLTKAKGG